MGVAIYFTAVVSEAYMNPEVIIARATFLGFEKEKPYLYTAAQLAGSFFCTALVYALCSNFFTDYEIAHGFLHNSEAAFSVEFVMTTVLMFAILALGDESNGTRRKRYPLLHCTYFRSCFRGWAYSKMIAQYLANAGHGGPRFQTSVTFKKLKKVKA